ncbi:Cys-tRNA(Pro) deacylase [Chitinimonas sp. BJB300]|uniref:Cys-tRNA(Pro) deacylase n=1 Tax=Chitinimonas sp. BJB300 TaxID=1559339 RepID=UPI000C0E40B1|nr:Cys-tRNA(Pro) deacylase [Chitinimonas sp. BJB300]PHV09588.1 Cys-tRNA(Pro) deacylase [Chitinimonas sp. BJB300]TSJ85936.1 Cys-tRNA(Pro) deacylase [Chitinimonas sp. BJB300]
MQQEKSPVTPAIRVLRQHKIDYTEHLYEYVEKGGTAESSRQLAVPEHAVIKTLVLEDETKKPLIVLMHGDCETSTRNLARQTGRKHIEPCTPEAANKHTGYLVGGTSPLGTKKRLPVYMEKSVLQLPRIYLNGGKRGFLVGLDPQSLLPLLQPILVEVANPRT